MKKIILLVLFSLSLTFTFAQTPVADSVTMGPGYANDVYYSFKNGTVSTSLNNNWHLAFRSGLQTDGIFINSTASVRAFLTNQPISAWSTIDTTHITTEIFNTDTSWEIGAFNRTFDNPYCSWGIYNTVSHVVEGDSLYMLKIGTNWVKLWIVEKNMGDWKIRIGNSTMDTTFTIVNNNFKTNIFSYVNALTGEVLTREPIDSSWDMKFTRYAAWQPAQSVYYPSTGVLNNLKVATSKVAGVDKVNYSDYTSHPFSNNISTIGADWKIFDNGTFQWKIADSVVYFITTRAGDIYKMYFTGFGGSSSGKSFFVKEKLLTSGIGDINNPTASFALYPNPAANSVSLVYSTTRNVKNSSYNLYSLDGKLIQSELLDMQNGSGNVTLNVSGLNNGVYIVTVEADGYKSSTRLVVAH